MKMAHINHFRHTEITVYSEGRYIGTGFLLHGLLHVGTK